MKVGIYSPFFNLLGGGEKYILTIAEVLSYDHQVEVVVPPGKVDLDEQKARIHRRFSDLDLHKIKFIRGPFDPHHTWQQKAKFTKQFDLFFYVTDNHYFWSRARKNVVIIQSPDTIDLSKFIDRFHLNRWQVKICYSKHIQNWLEHQWKIDAAVLPPAIDPSAYTLGKKDKIIISVGRFSKIPHDKKHKRMIRAFKDLVDDGYLPDWKFIMMGGLSQDDHHYFQQIKDESKGYPIEIIANSSFEHLAENYSKAKVYWHATGFEEDLITHPHKAEHFGITTVEAMASGAVPVVFNAGGHPEIVKSGYNGFTWESIDQLKHHTITLVRDPVRCEHMSIAARKKSFEYDKKNFRKKLYEVLI